MHHKCQNSLNVAVAQLTDLKILNILLVLVSSAPYTTEKPRPTPNLCRVQLVMAGLASSRKVLRKQSSTPDSSTYDSSRPVECNSYI